MHIGFVSAILPDHSLEDVVKFASVSNFKSVELMCWPKGRSDRRYSGVTHIDVASIDSGAIERIQNLFKQANVQISGLGYYPNPLSGDPHESQTAVAHLHRVIDTAADLGVNVVNTFVGRDPAQSVDDNWPRFLETWRPLVRHAEQSGIFIGIENCPMLFGADEWPGGKNLATTPAIWRRMFADIPSPHFGLNYDPSHLIWQKIDYITPLEEFKSRIVHVHAKDARIDVAALNDHGVLSYPKLWHTPKLPGQGDIQWGKFIGALNDIGYHGPISIEVEDRAFETSSERRKESLLIARRYLKQFIVG